MILASLYITIQCSTSPGKAVWLLRLEGDGEADNPGPVWDPFGEEIDDVAVESDGGEDQQPPEVEEPEQFGTDVVLETRQFIRAAPMRGWLGKCSGSKPGICFRLVDQGLGYYQDGQSRQSHLVNSINPINIYFQKIKAAENQGLRLFKLKRGR
jgi:hypothetical protein